VDAFDHVRAVLVYPTAYRVPDVWEDESGVVTEELDEREGEASDWGTVVLSWQQVVTDSRTLHGRNLVLHEFAHQLDLLDAIDRPTLGSAERRAENARWMDTFLDAHEAFCDQIDRGHRVKALDEYGAEDEAEFFAVATESFFERGAYLKANHPELYQVLSEYYNQDPASWKLPPTVPGKRSETGRERRRRLREEERRRSKRKANPKDP